MILVAGWRRLNAWDDVAGADGVRADAVRRSLGGKQLGDGDHAGLRHRIGGDLVHGYSSVSPDSDHRPQQDGVESKYHDTGRAFDCDR